ncbi:MAG: histidinol-phosphatase HisJ family protein [Anaerolineaceae bacterium]
MPPRLMDYHLHTKVTIDGKMTEDEVCERALLMDIQEIAFTNHAMLTEPDYTISHADFVRHWENIQTCRQHYPQLTIRLGLEIDYYEGREEEVATDIRQYEALIDQPFDLILGAVHHLNGVYFSSQIYAPDLYNHHGIEKLYQDYFRLATRAVQSRLFDVMAHPDLIKKYTGILSPPVPFEQYRVAAGSYVDALLDCNVGIEVNTKGLKQVGGEAYPSNGLLELYLSRAGTQGRQPIITLGSDAHDIAGVGTHLIDGVKMLQKYGQKSIMSFEKRVPTPFLL